MIIIKIINVSVIYWPGLFNQININLLMHEKYTCTYTGAFTCTKITVCNMSWIISACFPQNCLNALQVHFDSITISSSCLGFIAAYNICTNTHCIQRMQVAPVENCSQVAMHVCFCVHYTFNFTQTSLFNNVFAICFSSTLTLRARVCCYICGYRF